MAKKVLIIGSGGREHALAWKLKKSKHVDSLHFWPGGPQFNQLGTNIDCKNTGNDFKGLIEIFQSIGLDYVVVGPETPLAEGITDSFQEFGIPVFGPDRYCSQLESSKAFSKSLMTTANIPTASYEIVSTQEDCTQKAQNIIRQNKIAVLKASGLAGGKGVFICKNQEELDKAIDRLYGSMAKASQEIVLEEFLEGRECSYFCFIGKNKVIPIGFSVDFKRLQESDKGPNTGGMGSYCPVPWLPENAESKVLSSIVVPLLGQLEKNSHQYTGFLYVGVMWEKNQGPSVVEFNVRMGDPETQSIVMWDDRDWGEIFEELLYKPLPKDSILEKFSPKNSKKVVTMVMASKGYPYGEGETTPVQIPNELIYSNESDNSSLQVFQASVKTSAKDGEITTGNGRVLAITASDSTLKLAKKSALGQVNNIYKTWNSAQFRKDIANLAIVEESN